jgi:Tfp pilus assembly protein PilO
MSEQTEKNRGAQSKLYLILLILFLILMIIFGVLFLQKKTQVDELLGEKEQIRTELQSELDSLLQQHNKVKADYGQLSDSLAAKDSIIIASAKEIKHLLNYKWEYYQIKKKLSRLQVVAQGYVRQMDSLYTVNHALQEENKRIRESYRSEKRKNTQLAEEKNELKEIVTQAAVLRAYNITATGIRQRGARQKETDKAGRTDRVRVCFTIGENNLVAPGKKNIYLRIARPDNVILVYDKTDEYAFEFEGNVLQYSIKREIDYKGESINMCLFWNKRNPDEMAMAGRYHVTLYTDDALLGETSFELK